MRVLEKILEEIDTEVQKQREVCKDLKDTPGYRLYEKAAAVFKGIVEKHMDEVVGDGWILVSERLPEDGETVLCTDGEDIFLVEYDADLDAGFGDMDWIIAWQSLPEPYKGGE